MTLTLNNNFSKSDTYNKLFSEIFKNQELILNLERSNHEINLKLNHVEDLIETISVQKREFRTSYSSKLIEISSFIKEIPHSQEMILSNLMDSISGFKNELVREIVSKLKNNQNQENHFDNKSDEEIIKRIGNDIKNWIKEVFFVDLNNTISNLSKKALIPQSENRKPHENVPNINNKLLTKASQGELSIHKLFESISKETQTQIIRKLNFVFKILRFHKLNNQAMISYKSIIKVLSILNDISDLIKMKDTSPKNDPDQIVRNLTEVFLLQNLDWIRFVKDKLKLNSFENVNESINNKFLNTLEDFRKIFNFIDFDSI